MPQSAMSVFHSNILPEPNSGCWLWLGALGGDGYPKHKRMGRVNRWVVKNIRCEEIAGLLACHTCDTPLCVNPDHLYPGTPYDNTQDSKRSGRFYNVHKGRDKHWAGQSKAERQIRTRKGTSGFAAFRAFMTPKERSAWMRRAALTRWGKVESPEMLEAIAVCQAAVDRWKAK